MPHRFLRAIEPIVAHGLQELSAGASAQHTLSQIALMAALVGSGVSPTQAIRQVEAAEAQLIGLEPAEAAERMYHPGLAGAGAMPYGKGAVPYGKGATPYGKGATPYGKGAMPYGKGATPYGKGATPYGMGAVPYGKGAVPYGKGATPYGMGQPVDFGTMGIGPGMGTGVSPYMGGYR